MSLTEAPVVGVDPGGRHTGVVVRSADILVYWALLTRTTDPLDWYIAEVVDTVLKARDAARRHSLSEDPRSIYSRITIAVEDLNPPTAHLAVVNVEGLLATAQVLGAVSAHHPILRIPPGGHGSAPLNFYPAALRGGRESKGAGRLRHVRSAWDIAGSARYHQRLAAAVDEARP